MSTGIGSEREGGAHTAEVARKDELIRWRCWRRFVTVGTEDLKLK